MTVLRTDRTAPGAAHAGPVWHRVALITVVILLMGWLGWRAGGLQGLWSQPTEWAAIQARQPLTFAACFFCLFTVLSALALPGCGLLAVAAGLWFGLALGTALVLLASTVGATVSFLAARHLLRDKVQQRFGHRMQALESGLARDGAFYLFSLRVAPLIPDAIVNPLMGLSRMPLRQFFGISLLGMLAGGAVYVYAGSALATVPADALGWRSLVSPRLLAALVALALLPWCLRVGWQRLVAARSTRNQ